ncbi:MAG: hypothetical protein U1F30_06860 [Steroidobacteraceae bacterium]
MARTRERARTAAGAGRAHQGLPAGQREALRRAELQRRARAAAQLRERQHHGAAEGATTQRALAQLRAAGAGITAARRLDHRLGRQQPRLQLPRLLARARDEAGRGIAPQLQVERERGVPQRCHHQRRGECHQDQRQAAAHRAEGGVDL